jgi:RNA polymerase sigma-70 factor (ECF subfamily)
MADIRKKTQFEKLYDDFSDAVFRRCFFKTSDREIAKDITQESFVRLWKYFESGEDIENAKALLFRIANNMIIDHYRKKSSQSLDDMQEHGFDPPEDDHERVIHGIEVEYAMEIVNELPEMYKEAVVMRFVDEMQPKEIAEIIGESENVISVRIHRGLKKIREIVEDRERAISKNRLQNND